MQKVHFTHNPKKIIFVIAFVVVHIYILRNVFLLSKDMLYGDFSAEMILPAPRYGFERLPDNQTTGQFHAQNRLAVDFAQIYFPSQQMASLSENYQTGLLDPLQRPSRYAPLLHFLCSFTLCKLDYGIASLLHMLIQCCLFYLVYIISFRALKIEKDLLLGLLLVNGCLFLSPAGLSWFERGQFSLYVGTGYLLMILGFVKKKKFLILCSALFAFIKWTSFPYMLIAFSVYILNPENLAEVKQNSLVAFTFLLIIISLCLPFPAQSLYFLKGLMEQERYAAPGGISLAKIVPVTIAKALPIPMVVLGYLEIRKNHHVFEWSIPFLVGSGILMLTYPTLAYEYNLPSLLGFIPLLFYWIRIPNMTIDEPVRKVMEYSFFAFLFMASFSNYISQKYVVMSEYFLISVILLFLPWISYWRFKGYPGWPRKTPTN